MSNWLIKEKFIVFELNVLGVNIQNSKGGAIYHSTNNIHIFNSDFINNTANDKGGAVYFNGNRLNLINDTFKYNHADISTNNTGDAIFIDGYRAILTNCTCYRGFSLILESFILFWNLIKGYFSFI